MYSHESSNTMLFPLLVLVLFTLFIGSIGIPFNGGVTKLDLLSKWLTPSTIFFIQILIILSIGMNFCQMLFFSVSLFLFGLFIAYIFYGSIYSSFKNFVLMNLFFKRGPKIIILEKN